MPGSAVAAADVRDRDNECYAVTVKTGRWYMPEEAADRAGGMDQKKQRAGQICYVGRQDRIRLTKSCILHILIAEPAG